MKKIIIGLFIFFGIVNSSFALDITNTTYNSVYSNVSFYNASWTPTFINDGTQLVSQSRNNYMVLHDLSTPYDVTTSVLNHQTLFSWGDPHGFKFNDDGTKMFIAEASLNKITEYTLSTPYDFDTFTLVSSFNLGFNVQALEFSSDGTKMFVTHVSSSVKQYNLSTAWTISSAVYSGNLITLGTNVVAIEFFDDGSTLLLSVSGLVYQYNLSTPYDLSTNSFFGSFNQAPYPTTISGFLFEPGSNLGYIFGLGSNGNVLYQHLFDDTTPSEGSPVLELTASGTITETELGVAIENLETNTDFNLDYYINDVTNNIDIIDSGTLGAFSGGLNNININYNFTALGDYEVGLILTDPNDPFNVIIQEYTIINFTYNSGYIDPDTLEFSFYVSGYTFFENGFSLDNFLPNPDGGELYFEIIAPNPTGTGTVNITTETFGPYYIDGDGYGVDSSVIVTYPYHQTAGTYQVRTVYNYQETIVYPFGTDYNSYEITIAELPGELDIDFLDVNFFEATSNMFGSIKDFFRELMRVGKVEPKEWGFLFIPQANAESVIDRIPLEPNYTEDNILTDFYGFLKGFILFAFLILAVIILIVTLKKE